MMARHQDIHRPLAHSMWSKLKPLADLLLVEHAFILLTWLFNRMLTVQHNWPLPSPQASSAWMLLSNISNLVLLPNIFCHAVGESAFSLFQPSRVRLQHR